jgi:hypothetical protein
MRTDAVGQVPMARQGLISVAFGDPPTFSVQKIAERMNKRALRTIPLPAKPILSPRMSGGGGLSDTAGASNSAFFHDACNKE